MDGKLRQNYYFFAELSEGVDTNLVSNEGTLKWFEYSELAALDMPYSAKDMMEHYLEVGQGTEEIYVGVADGEKVIFTRMVES